LKRCAPARVSPLAIGEHAALREAGNLQRQLLGGGQRAASGDHPIDQPHAQRLVSQHRTTGENQIQRATLADNSWQTHGAAINQRHAKASAEHPKHRVIGHHPQISEQRQLQPAGYRVTFNSGDQWFAQLHAAGAHRSVTFGFQAIGALNTFGKRAQISTGAEGIARPRQNCHPRLLIRFKGP